MYARDSALGMHIYKVDLIVCSSKSKRLSTVLCTIQTKAKSQIDYQMKFRNLSVFWFNFIYFIFKILM